MIRTYDYYLTRWLQGVNMQAEVDYADPKSVRQYNRGSDIFRKAAADIGENYLDKVNEFSNLMLHENERVRLYAAISIAQYMPHTKKHLSEIKRIVAERMKICSAADLMVWEWWLDQPWAKEENCIDFNE